MKLEESTSGLQIIIKVQTLRQYDIGTQNRNIDWQNKIESLRDKPTHLWESLPIIKETRMHDGEKESLFNKREN